MDAFLYCMQIILEHEGGLTDDKDDPGGITNFGISLRFLRSLPNSSTATSKDIINMTREKATALYKLHWWDKYHYELFNSQTVVAKVFDMAVNMGGHQAHTLLQRAINSIYSQPIIIDGVLGAHTISAANKCNPNKLRAALRTECKRFYLDLIERKPNMEVFKNGWLSRAGW